jgi:hypothetical protein
MPEHAVFLEIPTSDRGLDWLFDLEDQLIAAIGGAGVGEFDGNEVGPDGAHLYMYGPDARALHDAIAPVLSSAQLPPGTVVVRRYGDPGAPEDREPI